jgi:protein TonB
MMVAGGLSVLAYGALAAWAALAPHARAVAAAPLEDMEVGLVELPPPPPLETPPPPRPAPRAVEPQEAPTAAPAQAAEVVAAPAPADEPVDLTDFSITTGNSERYAGGKTASSGTSTAAVTGTVAKDGVANGSGTGSANLSLPVRLGADEWSCPWPAQADALGVDEETVVIRVTVTAEGQLESAQLVSDPGYGFGAEALRCARTNRFEPALDQNGRAIKARSGPIRVRFTR